MRTLKLIWGLIRAIKSEDVHKELREVAKTLDAFCIIEILVIIFFCFMFYEFSYWYMAIMTVDKFNSMAFWGFMGAIGAGIFAAVKSIRDTHKKD